jgi:hypothetical protein
MTNHPEHSFVRALFLCSIVFSWNPSLHSAVVALQLAPASVLGTWKGESICVSNRPACKNEIVVYRFEAVPGRPDVVLLFADKIIEGERVPMGKPEFQYNEANGELSCEFTRNQTHGLWQFKLSGDSMEGGLVLLPGREPGRVVKIKRVKESEVPKAPTKDMYEEK